MASENVLDPSAMDGFGVGVLETSQDVETACAALVDFYNENKWSDEEATLLKLEEYGQAVKQKYKDSTMYDRDTLFENAPVKITDVKPEGGDDVFSVWEKKNLEILGTSKAPEYRVARAQLEYDIQKVASQERRKANMAGGDTSVIVEASVRAVKGAAGLIKGPVEWATGFDLNEYITERTDPAYDDSFGMALSEGVGSGVATVASMLNPFIGVPLLIGQGVDAVNERVQDTERITGDTGEVIKAGAVETGSQVVQAVADKLIFGKFANRLLGKTAEKTAAKIITKTASKPVSNAKEVVKGMGGEAFSEGAGQAISNVAENIQQGQDTFQDTMRNVPKAAVIGGIVAGGIGVVSTQVGTKKVAQESTGVRKQEIQDFGAPITPVTKQTIGPVHTVDVGAEVEINELDALGATEYNAEPGTDNSEPMIGKIVSEQSYPAFVTEDGSTYIKNSDGTVQRQDVQGNLDAPFDYVVPISEETVALIKQEQAKGAQVVVGEDNKPMLEIRKDNTITRTPIETAGDTIVDGTYPLEYSKERKPNKDTVIRPMRIGQRIRSTMDDPRSAGAMYAGEYGTGIQKETMLGRQVRLSEGLSQGMRDIAEEGSFYDTFPSDAVGADIKEEASTAGGFKNLVKSLLSGEYDSGADLKLKNKIGVGVLNAFDRAIVDASINEDFARVDELKTELRRIFPLVALARTYSGQALQASDKIDNAMSTAILKDYDSTYESEVARVANEEGIDATEIINSNKNAVEIDRQILMVEKEIEIQQTAEIIKDTAEVETLDAVISDIEMTAQDKLDEDLESIDRETEDLTKEVKTIEKKAKKTQEEDISVLEKAVLQDELALTEAISDGVELSTVTGEELETTRAEIESNTKKAESETNKLIKDAIKVERESRANDAELIENAFNNRLNRAKESYNKLKKASAESIKKLKMKERDALKDGNDEIAQDIQNKINAIEQRLIKSVERVSKVESDIQEYQESIQANEVAAREANEALDELESGVTISIVPTGRRRVIQVKTKRNGLDVTKLFKKGTAAGPLNALSRGINSLAETFKTSERTNKINNERISELQKRINDNKKALDASKKREALSEKEKAKIAAAKKRLADLAKAKSEATLESRIPKNKKKSYEKYKEAKAGRVNTKSERLKSLEEKAKELTRKKKVNAGLQEKNTEAKKTAAKRAAKVAKVQKEISMQEQLIKDLNLKASTRAMLEDQIALKKSTLVKGPKDVLYRMIVGNMIGQITGPVVGFISSVYAIPSKVTGTMYPSVKAMYKKAMTGKGYKPVMLGLLGGYLDTDARDRGFTNAKNILLYGKRTTTILELEQINPEGKIIGAVKSKLKPKDKTKTKTEAETEGKDKLEDEVYQVVLKDWINYVASVKPPKSPTDTKGLMDLIKNTANWIGYGTTKLTYPAGLFLRGLAAVEAVTVALHTRAVEQLSANTFYNEGLDAGKTEAELNEYVYDSKNVWAKAKAEAAITAKRLRDADLEMSAADERILAEEIYQQNIPENVLKNAFKIANQITLNAPATGLFGLASEVIQGIDNGIAGIEANKYNIRPGRYTVMFANSVANAMQVALEPTPLGFLEANKLGGRNRTQLERDMAFSSALVGTSMMAGMLAYGLGQLDLPEDERWFDIIGMYSDDRDKRAAFTQNGGLFNSIRIGDRYIPFGETPFAVQLGMLAVYMDRKRDGKELNASLFGTLSLAMYSAYSALGAISMFKSTANILNGIETSARDPETGSIMISRALLGVAKGLIPNIGIGRNISRYIDHPVEANKDLMSALVEGIPVVQSLFGKPALNVFGEPLAKQPGPLTALHRIFSTKRDDLDVRFLVDNGYSINGPEYIRDTKYSGELMKNPEHKYDVHKMAGPGLRATVSRYRRIYGSSAFRPDVQEALNRDIGKVYNRARDSYITYLRNKVD